MSSHRLLVFLTCLVLGVFLGSLIAQYLGPYFGILVYSSPEYGIDPPLVLSLGIIRLTLGCKVRLSVAHLVGIAITLLLYRKL